MNLRIDQVDRVTQIKKKIQRMGQVYHPGNASQPGHLYSPLPFPEFTDVPSQRGCVEERFELMRDDLLQLTNQGRLLDVGCHTGFHCFKFDELGFHCTGIDADELTIEIARDMAELYDRKIEFICSPATSELIESLGKFDVVIFTAVFQWITAAHGFESAKEFLRQLCQQCDVLYFETSMGQEGKAKMPMLPDLAAVEQLLQEVGHSDIEMVGSLDRSRFLFRTSRKKVDEVAPLDQVQQAIGRCLKKKPLHSKYNHLFGSQVWKETLDNGQDVAIKLVKVFDPLAEPMLIREHEFLAAIDSPHIPKWVLNGRMGSFYVLVSEWIDGPLLSEQFQNSPESVDRNYIKMELQKILAVLKDAGIRHRDIRWTNLIQAEGRLVLIDFGASCWANEPSFYAPADLVEPNDERAAQTVLWILDDFLSGKRSGPHISVPKNSMVL